MNDPDDPFFALMTDAGLTTMAMDVEPLVAGDVLASPLDQGRVDEFVLVDVGVEAWACGYWDACVCPGGELRSVRVMCLEHTPELAAIFDHGPGGVFETMWWWHCDADGVGGKVVNCTVSISGSDGSDRHRFTIRIALLPILVEAFAAVPVFALALVDDAGECDAETLSWFVDNDLDMWVNALSASNDDAGWLG